MHIKFQTAGLQNRRDIQPSSPNLVNLLFIQTFQSSPGDAVFLPITAARCRLVWKISMLAIKISH